MSVFFLNTANAVMIHVPKTGGISIRRGVFRGEYEGPVHNDQWPEHWPQERVFGFVRHPLTRFVSGVAYCRTMPFKGAWSLRPDAALDAVQDQHVNPDEHLTDFRAAIKHHLLPQSAPYYQLRRARFVGRFESLARDWLAISDWLGIEHSKLPRLNARNRQGRNPIELSQSERERATEIYREDFAYGYV